MFTLKDYLNKALDEGQLVGDKVDEGKSYSQVASLISTYHKKAEKMEIDLHKKIKSIVVKTDDKDELGKIAGAVGEVSEPGTYVSWKELEKSIGGIEEGAPPFLDPPKKSGKKPSYANINFKIKLSGVNDRKEAMKRAQRFIDDVSSKFKPFNPKGEIDNVG